MIKKFKKIIVCMCIMLLMCNILPSYADTIDGVDVVETESTAPTETTEETSEENTEETEKTTENEVGQSEDIVDEEIVKSTDTIDGEKVENENEDVDTTETTDVVATDSDAEEVDVEEEPEGEAEDIEESTTYAEEPEEDLKEEAIEMEVEIDEATSKPLLGKDETATMIASDSEAEEEEEEIVEEIEEEEATPSEAIDLELEIKAPVKLGASDPNNIYMYFDIPTSTMHFTDDNTKTKYSNDYSDPFYWSVTENNIPGYLQSIGVTTYKEQPHSVLSVVFDADLYPTSTKDLFCYMDNLTSITGLNKLHTENVTTMEAMFAECSSLTSVDLSSFVTNNVQNMNYMFMMSGLTSIDLSSWNTSSLQQTMVMFYQCPSIETIDLSSFNMSSATNANGMFNGCSALKNIYVSSSFTLPAGCTSTTMFEGCTQLPGYDSTKTDGTMISSYTKPKPTPTPPPAPPSGGSNGGSSGGGGGIASGPIKPAIVLPTSKTNIWVINNTTGKLNFISEADKTTVITKSWVKSDVQGVDGRYIVDNYGDILTGFVKSEGNLYYFSEENTRYGKMIVKEEINVNGEKYYFDERGVCITPKMPQAYYDVEFYNTEHQGLTTHLGYYFHFDDNRNMTIGLKEIDGALYYFSTEPNTRGRLTCGSINIGGATYFFDPNNGGRGTRIG